MKKSYNPFKMWGSYVGAMIMTALAVIAQATGYLYNIIIIIYKPLFFVLKLTQVVPLSSGTIALIITLSYGFLIGWGIHSIFRRIN